MITHSACTVVIQAVAARSQRRAKTFAVERVLRSPWRIIISLYVYTAAPFIPRLPCTVCLVYIYIYRRQITRFIPLVVPLINIQYKSADSCASVYFLFHTIFNVIIAGSRENFQTSPQSTVTGLPLRFST